MNRLKKAWLALMGRLEPEVREVVREVVGAAVATKLYLVHVPKPDGGYIEDMAGQRWHREHVRTYYATCEQAHGAHPDKAVTEVKAIRVGANYFVASDLKAIKLQPKPKRPKGKQ
jgi:hypothetical protein